MFFIFKIKNIILIKSVVIYSKQHDLELFWLTLWFEQFWFTLNEVQMIWISFDLLWTKFKWFGTVLIYSEWSSNDSEQFWFTLNEVQMIRNSFDLLWMKFKCFEAVLIWIGFDLNRFWFESVLIWIGFDLKRFWFETIMIYNIICSPYIRCSSHWRSRNLPDHIHCYKGHSWLINLSFIRYNIISLLIYIYY